MLFSQVVLRWSNFECILEVLLAKVCWQSVTDPISHEFLDESFVVVDVLRWLSHKIDQLTVEWSMLGAVLGRDILALGE